MQNPISPTASPNVPRQRRHTVATEKNKTIGQNPFALPVNAGRPRLHRVETGTRTAAAEKFYQPEQKTLDSQNTSPLDSQDSNPNRSRTIEAITESKALINYRESGQYFEDDPNLSELIIQHSLKDETPYTANLFLNRSFLNKINEYSTNYIKDIDFQITFSDLPRKYRQFVLFYLHAKKISNASKLLPAFVKTLEFCLEKFLSLCLESNFTFYSSQGLDSNSFNVLYLLNKNATVFEVKKNIPSSVYFFIKFLTRYLVSDQSNSFIYNPCNKDVILIILDYLKTYKSYDSVFDFSVSELIINFFYKLCLNIHPDSIYFHNTFSILKKFIDNGLLIERENETKQFFEIKLFLAKKILDLFNHENKGLQQIATSFLINCTNQKEFMDQDLVDNLLDKLCLNILPNSKRLPDTLAIFDEFIKNDLLIKIEIKQSLMGKMLNLFDHKNLEIQRISIEILLNLAKQKKFAAEGLIDSFLDKLCLNVYPDSKRLSDAFLVLKEFIGNNFPIKDEIKQLLIEKLVIFFDHENLKLQFTGISFLLFLARTKDFINRDHIVKSKLVEILVNFFESKNCFESLRLQGVVITILGLLRVKGLVNEEEEKKFNLDDRFLLMCRLNGSELKKFSWAKGDDELETEF